MKPVRRYRPIVFHQACAIARAVLMREPSMTNFDWSDEVKRTCVKQGYYPPAGDELLRAMQAVERALAKDGRPRPGPAPAYAPLQPPATLERPLSHQESVAILTDLGARGFMKPMKPARALTLRDAELQKASRIVATEIVESIQRCEDAERSIETEATL